MKNIIKIFLLLFISFYTALGINNFVPHYKAPITQAVIKCTQELTVDKNVNNHAIAASNNASSQEFITQEQRKIQLGNGSVAKYTTYFNNLTNLYLKNKISQISFHNISYYYLKNEIHTRAP